MSVNAGQAHSVVLLHLDPSVRGQNRTGRKGTSDWRRMLKRVIPIWGESFTEDRAGACLGTGSRGLCLRGAGSGWSGRNPGQFVGDSAGIAGRLGRGGRGSVGDRGAPGPDTTAAFGAGTGLGGESSHRGW